MWIRRRRPDATFMGIDVAMKRKKASSVYKVLKIQVEFFFILQKAYLTNSPPCTLSAGKSSCSSLYEYKSRILPRILHTEDGGEPKSLATSRILLVPAAESVAKADGTWNRQEK